MKMTKEEVRILHQESKFFEMVDRVRDRNLPFIRRVVKKLLKL